MARTTKAREPLSRDRVLRTALALVDHRGIEGLSMRKLAQELGVEAMSLYNHVESKDDIVAGMLDLVAAEIDLPADDADWKAGLRGTAISAHEAFGRRPWAARIWMSASRPSPVRFAHADEYLVVADLRLGHLAELDCVDTEPLADDRLHLFLPRRHTV